MTAAVPASTDRRRTRAESLPSRRVSCPRCQASWRYDRSAAQISPIRAFLGQGANPHGVPTEEQGVVGHNANSVGADSRQRRSQKHETIRCRLPPGTELGEQRLRAHRKGRPKCGGSIIDRASIEAGIGD